MRKKETTILHANKVKQTNLFYQITMSEQKQFALQWLLKQL